MDLDTGTIAALAGLAGVVLTKIVDAFVQKFKSDAEGELTEKQIVTNEAARIRAELWDEIENLRTSVRELQGEVKTLNEENIKLRSENARLQLRIEELEDKLSYYTKNHTES